MGIARAAPPDDSREGLLSVGDSDRALLLLRRGSGSDSGVDRCVVRARCVWIGHVYPRRRRVPRCGLPGRNGIAGRARCVLHGRGGQRPHDGRLRRCFLRPGAAVLVHALSRRASGLAALLHAASSEVRRRARWLRAADLPVRRATVGLRCRRLRQRPRHRGVLHAFAMRVVATRPRASGAERCSPRRPTTFAPRPGRRGTGTESPCARRRRAPTSPRPPG